MTTDAGAPNNRLNTPCKAYVLLSDDTVICLKVVYSRSRSGTRSNLMGQYKSDKVWFGDEEGTQLDPVYGPNPTHAWLQHAPAARK